MARRAISAPSIRAGSDRSANRYRKSSKEGLTVADGNSPPVTGSRPAYGIRRSIARASPVLTAQAVLIRTGPRNSPSREPGSEGSALKLSK